MAISPRELIDRVVDFENDLAAFYADIRLDSHLEPLAKICRFMSQHSQIHAQLIANYRENADIPQLNVNPLEVLHERLKSNLRKELGDETDIAEVARKLSQAEEIVAKAYEKIAAHYEAVSAAYQKIAGKYKSLANDERDHQDYILRERKRIEASLSSTTSEDDP